MSELSHYIKLRSGLSGCNAKQFECDKYLDCDSCLEDKIKEHDKQIRAEVIDEVIERIKQITRKDMPLTFTAAGKTVKIVKVKGKDDTVRFLQNLGFVEGEPVAVISENAGGLIVKIKDGRVAISKEMACRILVG